MPFAVDRQYFSGLWDSNGHERLFIHRYRCDTADEAVARYHRVLSDPLTRRARILKLNQVSGRYEPVAAGDIHGVNVLGSSLPTGNVGRNIVQSVLFRWAFLVIS